MAATRYDVLGIGNAIVDVIARTDDDFLARQRMPKGTMQLIDEARASAIYDAMGPAMEVSGGSAANTVAGVASLGARAAFVGKVKDDELGRVFAHDIRAAGVAYETPPASDGPATARCYVLVTPDGERTMNTYLGAAQDLHPNDIDADAIAAANIVYLEGYLWDPPKAKEAFLKAAEIAHHARSATLRSPSPMHSASIAIVRNSSISSAPARSISSSPTSASCTAFMRPPTSKPRSVALRNDAKLAVVTRSEKGCLVVSRDADRRGAGEPGRARGRCDRGRRLVRGRVPGRMCRAAADYRTRCPARRARGCRGNSAPRAPAPRPRSRRWPGPTVSTSRSRAIASSRCAGIALSTAIHRNSDRCRGVTELSWRCWHLVAWREGPLHPEVAMSLPVDRLPNRFPVGTRYVIEGRGGGRRAFAYPHALSGVSRRPARRSAGRSGGADAGAPPRRGPRPGVENNFARAGTLQGLRRWTLDAGWRAPQPPTPHPSGDRPWSLRAPGSSSLAEARMNTARAWNMSPAARLNPSARSVHTVAGVSAGWADPSS